MSTNKSITFVRADFASDEAWENFLLITPDSFDDIIRENLDGKRISRREIPSSKDDISVTCFLKIPEDVDYIIEFSIDGIYYAVLEEKVQEFIKEFGIEENWGDFLFDPNLEYVMEGKVFKYN